MNTTGTGTYGSSWRAKYFSSKLQSVLRKALVAEAVCQVDRSDSYYIHNPYSNQPTAAMQALTGTYSVSAWTITDDTLTVTDEAVYGEHIFDFERVMNNYDLMSARMDEMAYAVAFGIDNFVVNALCEDGTGTYATPAGGFSSANTPVIISNLLSKVAGFADAYRGTFLIVENTDLPGIIQAAAGSGFQFSDNTLNNGFAGRFMGVDIYTIRSGGFVSATIGSRSDFTNSGHRVFGVKGVATYAAPRGIQYMEKAVTGKTGMEIAVVGYVGFKLWTQKASLVVDITLA